MSAPDPSPRVPVPQRRAYLLRLCWRAGRWQMTLQDVQAGPKLEFTSFAALLGHLEALSRREGPPTDGGLR